MISSKKSSSDGHGEDSAIGAVTQAWKRAKIVFSIISAVVAFWTWIKIGANRDLLTSLLIYGAPFLVAVVLLWARCKSRKLGAKEARKLEKWSLAGIVAIANVQIYWLLAYIFGFI
jgi:hypothetical protein